MAGQLTKNFERAKGKQTLLYEQVGQRLREQILCGQLKPGQKIPPVTRLVKDLGVNYQTVSSALDMLERDGFIQREPHKRPVVRMDVKPSLSVAFVRWCGDPLCTAISEGVDRYQREIGQECILIDAYCRHENFLNAISQVPDGVSGLLIMPFKTPPYYEAIRHALSAGVKMVFIDRILEGVDVGSVASDHFNIGFMATRHLIEAHRGPVCHINIQDGPSSSQERYRGWVSAMQRYGYFNVRDYFFPITAPEEETTTRPELNWVAPYETAKRMFAARKDSHYYVFAGDDHTAYGVYKAAEELGLKIGQDVFVIGCDDAPICEQLPVPLTSVRCQNSQMGYEAAKLLHQQLTGAITKPLHRILPVELKIRASSM